MFYPRKILPEIEKELDSDQVILVTGMRRVGKTTLLNYLFRKIDSANKTFFDLENPLHRKVFQEEDYDNIWDNLEEFGINKKKRAFVFIDEIQNLPEISRVVKYLYDHWKVKFFLTGSSSFYLKNLFPESLAGRKLIYELYPLTFSEFLTFKGVERKDISGFSDKAKSKNEIRHERLSKHYRQYSRYGGFPEVVLEENLKRKEKMLEDIFKSYFEQDVKSLGDFKDISRLRELILLLVPRIGSKIDVSKLASNLGISRETVYSHLSFLEATYFIQLLPQFSRSIDRQAAGSKKLYICDTGLANILGRFSEGQELENSIFQILRPHHDLYYYRKDSGEIDFIVDGQTALEVKMSVSSKDMMNLKRRSKGLSLQNSYVVSREWSDKKDVVLAIDL